MTMHLNRTALASAAIAAVTVGVLAVVCKKYKLGCGEKLFLSPADATDAELRSNIGPGEINPYVDTPTDSASQN